MTSIHDVTQSGQGAGQGTFFHGRQLRQERSRHKQTRHTPADTEIPTHGTGPPPATPPPPSSRAPPRRGQARARLHGGTTQALFRVGQHTLFHLRW